MTRFLILVAPAANRVYAGQAVQLTAAELEICGGPYGLSAIEPVSRAGVDYVAFTAEDDQRQRPELLRTVAGLSASYALFAEADHGLLRPEELISDDRFSDDLITIPKYQGKTNEQFTRLLVNVTAASTGRQVGSLLDPVCGRGTTLSVGLTVGLDVGGVELDGKAVEAYAAFLKSYLRRKRIKHKAEINPVRREGKALGRKLEAEITADGGATQQLTVFTGDTRQSAKLFGKRRFDLVVADAPYGVVHGSSGAAKRDRSPQSLLAEALPVWAGPLRAGGALGLAWNTYGLSREELTRLATDAGLEPCAGGPYARLGHRVDSAIYRDVFIARKPGTDPT